MITLVYSPYFGPRPYVDLAGRGGVLMGVSPVGTMGLLDALELHFGNKGTEPESLGRLIAYVQAMRQAIADDPTLFFAESFRGDEIGTAKIILSWRDVLLMALWNPEEASTEKLRGLSAIEKHFHCSGIADRWRALLARVSEVPMAVPGSLAIECRTSAETLEPCVRKVLETLKEKGMSVSFYEATAGTASEGTALRLVQDALVKGVDVADGEKMTLPDDGSFRHVVFKFGYDAARWAALSAREWRDRDTLLVNARTSEMNGSLRVLGQPTLRSDIEGAPQSAQLFLLGLSLFRKPVDVQRLLSYLRVSPNPIGKLHLKKANRAGEPYFKALNRELTDILLEKGGFDGWNEAIDGAIYDKEGAELKPADRNRIHRLFRMWEKAEPDGSVPKEALQSWLKQMRLWANGLAQVIPDDPGYASLVSNCEAMEMLLEGAPERVDAECISRWAEGIFSTITMTADIAESGAGEAVPDIRDTMDSPGKVVWLGVCGADVATYPYPFLSTRECRLLNLPSREKFSAAAHRSLVESIARVRESLTLVSFGSENGAELAEHPVITELSARFNLPALAEDDLQAGEAVETFPVNDEDTSREVYRVNPDLFKGLDKIAEDGGMKLARESFSSLDTLIQRPFDYVMQYLLQFDPYDEQQLSDLAIVKGNVAHLYVHNLVENSGMDLEAMEKLHAEAIEAGVLAAAEMTGAILLTRENGLEWGKFKTNLRISVDSLLGLIRLNGYRIIGSEKEIKTDLPVIGPFIGYVDLLLEDHDQKLVVFDLKWNESTTYKKKMEKRDIMQLILYKEALRLDTGKDVSVYGYWLLPQYTFLTESDSVLGDNVIHYNTEPENRAAMKDLFEQVKNSYVFRMDQIRHGIIEEGELMPLADLDYFNQQGARNLYPLRGAYKNEGLKERPYGMDNLTLKGGLE